MILRVSGAVSGINTVVVAGVCAATRVRMAMASIARTVNRCQGAQPRHW